MQINVTRQDANGFGQKNKNLSNHSKLCIVYVSCNDDEFMSKCVIYGSNKTMAINDKYGFLYTIVQLHL